MRARLLVRPLTAFCVVAALVACSSDEQSESADPEPSPVDLAALTADWEVMSLETLGAPEVTADVGNAAMTDLMTTLPPALMAASHLDPLTLAGSRAALERDIEQDWELSEDYYDRDGGLNSLFHVTRFGDEWSVEEVRGRGAWKTTSQDVTRIHAEWVGSLAYDLTRGDETRTVVIGRELTYELPFATGRMRMDWSIDTTDMDWCASHEASAFVPGDRPTEVSRAVSDPTDPSSGPMGDISDVIEECEQASTT